MSQEVLAVAPGTPVAAQINLLPPQITARRRLRLVQRWLVIAIALALVVALGAVVWTSMVKNSAERELEDARAETQRLLAAQAQYSEVPQILDELESVQTARELGMGTEILWSPYLSAITAVLPDDMSLEEVSVFTPPQFQSLLVSSVNPPNTVAATLTFTAQATELPDNFDWLESLEELVGVVDVYYTAADTSDDDGEQFYEINAQLALSVDAFSGQHAPEDLSAAADSDEAGDSDGAGVGADGGNGDADEEV